MKDAIGYRQYKISDSFAHALEKYKEQHFSKETSQSIAKSIARQSQYYIEFPFGKTAWKETETQIAQTLYYLPLNYLRNVAVCDEIRRLNLNFEEMEFYDLGSGLGAASVAIHENLNPARQYAIESSQFAIELQKKLNLVSLDYLPDLPNRPAENAVLWCSYSLTEIRNPLPFLLNFNHVIIVEPSTQKDSQVLIGLRQNLIDAGYKILAPCTHQSRCPLMGNRSDWCHDKVYFELWPQMQEIESHLTWRNRDLTFSYLIASRLKESTSEGKIRLIGDTLFEKGKKRQMICRSDKREFFSWLDRDKSYSPMARGSLTEQPSNTEEKGSEVRIK